jgi:tetratricopeptide (TPR) repeat protein
MRAAAIAFLWLFLTAAAPAPKSHVVGGVNFDEIDLGGGVRLHHGTFTAQDPAITTTLQSLFSGQVAGKTVAVTVLHYELPATGYNEGTQVFEVAGGQAKRLGSIGEFSFFSDSGPYPKGSWVYVSFADGRLYADVWNEQKRCDKNHDWTSSTYTIRGGKLVRLYALPHHRSGVSVACGEAPFVKPDAQTSHYNHAVQLDGKKQYAQAVAEWNKALQLAPNDTDALLARASDYISLGQYDKALGDYNRAEKLGDHDVWINWGRGIVYIYTNKYTQALAEFDAAVKATQSSSVGPVYTAAALENRATALFAMRRFSESVRDLNAALALQPGNVHDLAMLYLAMTRSGGSAVDSEALAALASSRDRCDASFFTGENALLRNDAGTAHREFVNAESACDRWSFQRYIARAELAG